MTSRPRALLAMSPHLPPLLFDDAARTRLAHLAELDLDLVVSDFADPSAAAGLARAEVLISGWECPPLTAAVLDAAPHLKAVIHAGGSVKHHITDASWSRGLIVSSAASANAVPVAEYTLASIIMANKRILPLREHYRELRAERGWAYWTATHPTMGNYRRTVGVIGCSQIGRRVISLLRNLELEIVVYDPYLSEHEAAELEVGKVDLDELLTVSDVVTVHAPANEETLHLIDRRRLALMRDGATLINTARGSLVETDALTEELRTGRIFAVLDVIEPVPPADSALFDLPNLLLTPHVAGSHGLEIRRMGELALDELERYTRSLPFAHPVRPELLARAA